MNEEPKDFGKTPLPQTGPAGAPGEKRFLAEAENFRAQNRLDEAIALLKEGLSGNPGDLPARLLLGRCYWEKEMPGEAKIELETVAGVIEACLPVYKYLSKVYVHERKDVDKALEAVRRALYFTAQESARKKPAGGEGEESGGKAPRQAIQTDTLAEIFLRQGKPEKALAIYARILSEDPANESARRKFAALQKKIGRGGDAAARENMVALLEKWLEKVTGKKEP
jgi:tetratricopeptide (TPR) repeat protein